MKAGMRELVLLVLLLAGPVASYFFVFGPQNREIARAKSEIELKRDMLERLRAETARNADLERANGSIGERLRQIESRLPTDKEVDTVVRQVSALAIEAGLAPPAMVSTKPVSAAFYQEQPLELTTWGDFNGYYRFLQMMERMPRVTRVPDMKLVRDTKVDGAMKIEFTLSIYFQESAGDSGKGANS